MNYINLPSKLIDVSVEVESYRFLNMVAEIGGKREAREMLRNSRYLL